MRFLQELRYSYQWNFVFYNTLVFGGFSVVLGLLGRKNKSSDETAILGAIWTPIITAICGIINRYMQLKKSDTEITKDAKPGQRRIAEGPADPQLQPDGGSHGD